jgi:hypothetical protein
MTQTFSHSFVRNGDGNGKKCEWVTCHSGLEKSGPGWRWHLAVDGRSLGDGDDHGGGGGGSHGSGGGDMEVVVVKAKLGSAVKAVAEEVEEATERRRWKRSKQP